MTRYYFPLQFWALSGGLVVMTLLIAIAASTQTPKRNVLKQMDRATIDGAELEYEIRGTGEPVALVHAGVFAGWFKPLLEEPALTGRYRVLSYHRIGYAGSSRSALYFPLNKRSPARFGQIEV